MVHGNVEEYRRKFSFTGSFWLSITSGLEGRKYTRESCRQRLFVILVNDENLVAPNFGGKVFTAHEILGAKAEEIYVWAYAQEFYKENNALEKGTGLSCPVVLTVDSQDEKEVNIIDHKMPRDGSFCSQDIKTLFPKKVQDAIFNIHQGQTIPELSYQVEERARKWFNIQTGMTVEEIIIKEHIPKPFNPVIHANKLEFHPGAGLIRYGRINPDGQEGNVGSVNYDKEATKFNILEIPGEKLANAQPPAEVFAMLASEIPQVELNETEIEEMEREWEKSNFYNYGEMALDAENMQVTTVLESTELHALYWTEHGQLYVTPKAVGLIKDGNTYIILEAHKADAGSA